MEIIVFNILRYILIGIFVQTGIFVTKVSKKRYWKFMILPTLFYAIMEGTRWMRGVDYNYNYRIAKGLTTSGDIAYDTLAAILHNSGFPFYVFFIIISGLLIYSLFTYIQDCKEAFIPIIILMYAFTMQQSENLMRQYCAISLSLLAIYCVHHTKYTQALIWVTISYFTHSSVLFLYAFTGIAYLFLSSPIRHSKVFRNLHWIFLFLYCISFVLRAVLNYFFSKYAFLLENMDIIGKYSEENYLTVAFAQVNDIQVGASSLLDIIRSILRNIVVIYFGFNVIKKIRPRKKHKIKLMFVSWFLACCGIVYHSSLPQLNMEVIGRLAIYLCIFIYFIEGYIIYYYFNLFKTRSIEGFYPIKYILILLVLMESVWILKPVIGSSLGLHFIWS